MEQIAVTLGSMSVVSRKGHTEQVEEHGEALQEAGEASKTSVEILQEIERHAASTSSEQTGS